MIFIHHDTICADTASPDDGRGKFDVIEDHEGFKVYDGDSALWLGTYNNVGKARTYAEQEAAFYDRRAKEQQP